MTTTLEQLSADQVSKEIVVNENTQTLSHVGIFGKRSRATSGLTWGYYGGLWRSAAIANGTVTLAADQANYVVVHRSTGAVSVSTSTTAWNDTNTYARLYKITTGSATVTGAEDHRAGWLFAPEAADVEAADVAISDAAGDFDADNVEGALAELQADAEAHLAASDPHTQYARRLLTINSQPGDYTLALADADTKMVEIASASPNSLTVPANSSVALPVGTAILIKQGGVGQTTVVADTGVTVNVRAALTLGLAGQYAIATLIKEATDTWLLAGDLEAA
jgi:hypothetical protein